MLSLAYDYFVLQASREREAGLLTSDAAASQRHEITAQIYDALAAKEVVHPR